jgi:hypothetical protein
MLLAGISAGLVAFAVIAVDLIRPDCPGFEHEAAAFRDDHERSLRLMKRSGTAPDSGLRERAETLVRCESLVGRTAAQVMAALGVPDRRDLHSNPRPHRDFAYTLGEDSGSVSNTEVYLFMEVDRNLVVYATVDGETRKVVDGDPVGGGARGAP